MNSLISGIWTKQAVFFKAIPEKGLAEKKSRVRKGKKSKTRLIIAFFVNSVGVKANRVALKTLRIYPDPMAFITTPIRKYG